MPSIIDYAKTFTKSFDESPFSEVDSLVLSELTYSRFDGYVPARQSIFSPARRLRDIMTVDNAEVILSGVHDADSERKLIAAVLQNPRYRDMRVSRYVSEFDCEREIQFCGITYIIGSIIYVAFRGTDSTVVGWKEDFNMSFMDFVPAQKLAVEYLNETARRFHGGLYVGGHSKGGNLAVYAAVMCDKRVQKRLINVFSHDGPGFKEDVLDKERFSSVNDRIKKTVPQSSLIGMVLETKEAYTTIKSNASGITQHSPYSWEVEDGSFIELEGITKGARYIDGVLSKWLSSLTDEKREIFVDALFSVVEATGAKSTKDLSSINASKIKDALSGIKSLDSETKSFVLETILHLASTAIKDTVKLVERS